MTRIIYTRTNLVGDCWFYDIYQDAIGDQPAETIKNRCSGSLDGVISALNQLRIPVPDGLIFPPLPEPIVARYNPDAVYYGYIAAGQLHGIIEVVGNLFFRVIFRPVRNRCPALASEWRAGNQHIAYLTPPPMLTAEQIPVLLAEYFDDTECQQGNS